MIKIKKYFLFLLLCCFLQDESSAQNANKIIDSLLNALKIANTDITRIKNLNHLSEHCYRTGRYAEAEKYATEAREIAIKNELNGAALLEIKNGKAAAISNIGTIRRYQGKFSEALPFHLESLKIFEETGNKNRIAMAHISIGNDYLSVGNYAEAMNCFRACLKISEEISNKLGICLAYGGFGLIAQLQGNYSESLQHNIAALKLREEMGDKFGIANTYNSIAGINYGQGKLTEALKYFGMSLKIRQEIDDRRGMASSYNSIGDVYLSQGNYLEALKNQFSSLKIRREIDDNIGVAFTSSSIGQIYQSQGNYSEALNNHQAALKSRMEAGDKRGIAISHNNIGLAYQAQDNFPEALKNYFLSVEYGEELGDKRIVSAAYNNIGAVYKIQGNYTLAFNNFNSSLKLNEIVGNKSGIIDCCNKLGELLLTQAGSANTMISKQGYEAALSYLDRAILLAKEIGEKDKEKTAYQIISKVYATEKNYTKALAYQNLYITLKDSLMNNETTRKLEQQRTQYEVEKAVAVEKVQQEKVFAEQKFQNDQKLTEENSKHQLELAEEKLEKEKAIEIEKLKYEFTLAEERTEQEKIIAEQKFENEKNLADENAQHQQALASEKAAQQIKDAEAKVLLENEKAEKKRRSELYITLLSILGLVSIFVIILIRQRNLKRRAVDKAETGHKMAELELQSLRAQLNPHFMFNSLNAIQDLILKEDNHRSHLYLSRFSKLLRMMLDNANQPFVSVKHELEFLELYLSLENLRLPDLQFTIEKDARVNAEERMVPNMMLQPYIENAIWHGLSHKKGEKKLEVRIHENGSATEFEIEDNGIGRKKATEIKELYRKGHLSKGMELLSKRFNLLSSEYGEAIHTSVIDLENNGEAAGTLVKIEVPFILSEKAKRLVHDTNHHN